jgi:ferredoxin
MARSRAAFKAIVGLTPLGAIGKKAARLPVLDRLLGPLLWNEYNLDATYVPVGETVEVPFGNALPVQILDDLVRMASRRFVLEACYCRTAFKCTEHPRDIGCIFLGDAVEEINPELGREVDVQSALEHISRATAENLSFCIVHSSWDATMLGIKNYARMLAICFCCDCCCVFRTDMRKGPTAYRDRIIRLPGLEMMAVGDCTGCEKCARACFLGAVTVGPEGPVFADFCKGCGACAAACPESNIRVTFRPGYRTREELMLRIGARTDITGGAGRYGEAP